MTRKEFANNILLLLLGLLFFILPVGHTIALRNVLFIFLSALTIFLYSKTEGGTNGKFTVGGELGRTLFILLAMTVWIIFVNMTKSDPALPWLRDIKHDWIYPLLYFFAAFFVVLYALKQNESFQYNTYLALFIAMFIHVLYVDLFALKHYLYNKELLVRFAGLTEGPDKADYITNILLTFVISDIVYRLRTGKQLLAVNNFVLAALVAILIFSSIVEGMRNGAVTIVFTGILASALAFVGNAQFSRRFKMLLGSVLLAGLIVPMLYNISHDKRWAELIDTIPISMHTQQHKHWLNREKYPLPRLPDGRYVDLSTYLRVAWLTEGIKIVMENPWGIGYSKNAFGNALKAKYGDDAKHVGHSHSGIVDLAIGAGIPGVVIWLCFGLYLCYLACVHFFRRNNAFALILFFNVTVFYSRFFVDSIMRDHMFLTFMFINGFALSFMLGGNVAPSNGARGAALTEPRSQ